MSLLRTSVSHRRLPVFPVFVFHVKSYKRASQCSFVYECHCWSQLLICLSLSISATLSRFSSVQTIASDSLPPHGLQHARPPRPSPTPRVYSNSCPLSQWCHPTISSSVHWTWVWLNSGRWWWTGRPGVLRFMGSQRVRHDWATELNWYSSMCMSIPNS